LITSNTKEQRRIDRFMFDDQLVVCGITFVTKQSAPRQLASSVVIDCDTISCCVGSIDDFMVTSYTRGPRRVGRMMVGD